MLAVVIESGVVYFALLAWFGAIDVWGSPNSIVTTTTRFYMSPLIAMYPTLVVVLVAMRRSMLERSVGSTTAALSGVLFATHASASMNAPVTNARISRDLELAQSTNLSPNANFALTSVILDAAQDRAQIEAKSLV
ncbi:hypothetical protein PENSPDRAFT_400768 [Peniophora sp. CONT]|nr:hypothetical protein PENSPDRAFT_400768 [Peniophora sp. CONT]